MAKKIQETIERWCCEPQDIIVDQLHLEPVHDDVVSLAHPYMKPGGAHNPYRYKVCKHCGQRYEYYSFTDAAGSSDWDYREMQTQDILAL